MTYRVIMELIPRPNGVSEWEWNETNSGNYISGVSSNGGKAWTGKLSASDSVWEYDSESDANTKKSQLELADSTNRRYKVIEV